MRKGIIAALAATALVLGMVAANAVTINGGPGDDVLKGTGQADTINARKGNDLVKARNGDDTVLGKDGNDQLFGQGGNDVVNGGYGDDQLWGGSSPATWNNVPDVFKCGPGNDRIFDFEEGVDKIVGTGGVQEDPYNSATCETVDFVYGPWKV